MAEAASAATALLQSRKERAVEVGPNIHALRMIGSNSYLIVEDELTLIDAGHRGSIRLLEAQLKRIGRSIGEITRIVCTHGHPDHIGGAHAIAHRSGAKILMHPADEERLRITFRDVVSGRPAPGAIVAYLTRLPPHVVPVVDGSVLPALGGLEVIHTPGHTPGSICLYSATRRLLIVGDILQRRRGEVTFPNYLFSDDMGMARRSIARIAELEVNTILFSHFPALHEGAQDALRRLAS